MKRLCLLFLLFALPAAAESRLPVRGRHAMVASVDVIASRVGADVMKRGGNAVDAAVAVAFTLAVTWPEAGNLGGGGFMLVRTKDGKSEAIDYRETAPAASTRNMYLDASGKVTKDSTLGYRAVAVPGTVAGLALAHKRYGRLPWRTLVEPARKLAADGFIVSQYLERSLKAEDAQRMKQFPESWRIYGGRHEGERFVQPELAAVLARIANDPGDFYRGVTAKNIVAAMKAPGGLITARDLAQYAPKIRTPLRGTYRGYEIVSMPPPSSGGIALIEMLNMLEPYDLKSMGWHSSQEVHTMLEVMRRAYADRAKYLGDPDFARMPVAGLTSKAYAEKRRADIDPEKATDSRGVGAGDPAPYESASTTHFSVADKDGMLVSNTYTLNDSFGAAVSVSGFLLNDEMDDFASRPGTPNLYGLVQGEANATQPRKRALVKMAYVFHKTPGLVSSKTPGTIGDTETIAFDADGVRLGASDGRRGGAAVGGEHARRPEVRQEIAQQIRRGSARAFRENAEGLRRDPHRLLGAGAPAGHPADGRARGEDHRRLRRPRPRAHRAVGHPRRARGRRAREHARAVGARGGDRLAELRRRRQAAREEARHRQRRRQRHHLGLAPAPRLPRGIARLAGIRADAGDRRDRPALRHHRRRGAQSDRRADEARHRDVRRHHRQGEDQRLLRRRRAADARRARRLPHLRLLHARVHERPSVQVRPHAPADGRDEAHLGHADDGDPRRRRRLHRPWHQDRHPAARDGEGLVPPRAESGSEEDHEADPRLREAAQPRRENRVGGGHAAVQSADQRPARRRGAPRHEVRLRPRAGLRPRGRLDRRRRLDGEGLPLPGPLPRPLASGARLPRPERELRLAAGLRRDDCVREVLRRTFYAIIAYYFESTSRRLAGLLSFFDKGGLR